MSFLPANTSRQALHDYLVCCRAADGFSKWHTEGRAKSEGASAGVETHEVRNSCHAEVKGVGLGPMFCFSTGTARRIPGAFWLGKAVSR